ncbi:MAG TPA: tRNA (guanosine(37)-N1)-methyltransferase TrmD [Acidimicrobiia bacterium]|nr:tRNA (guanosine(37)-N1)-methyltransferase TrmD [Acidimicrobiia bacterium]
MRIDVFSIFPDYFAGPLGVSLLGRAREAGLLDVRLHDPRDFAADRHRTVDDTPFGGGAGMIMAPGPLFAAFDASDAPRPLLLLSAAGRRFDQAVATELAARGGFSLLCGRYEGVDQRVADYLCDGELSVGDYVLAGGEAAALVVIDAVARLVHGVMGNAESERDESFATGLLEYPQYTRPAEFRGHAVPDVLRTGDHARVARWRRAQALRRTLSRRPDLLGGRPLTPGEEALLTEFPEDASGSPDTLG